MATAPTFNLGSMQGSTDWTVDPKTQTVAGQLESVIKTDSPLMQQARARALEAKNKSGLMNSSMAMGAADSAMYDTALNIAAPDANTYASAAQNNAASKNTFANNANQYTQQGKMAEYTANANDWGAQQEFGRTTQRDATQQGYTQANLNLGSQIDLNKMAVGQGYTQANMNLGTQQDLTKMGVAQDYTKQNAATQQGYTTAKAATQQGYNLENMSAQQVNDLAKIAAQSNTAMDVADIEAQYKSLTQGSQSATSIVNKMQDSLNALMANKDLSGEENKALRTQMETDIKNNAKDALDMIGSLSGDMDFSSYVNGIFGTEAVAAPTPTTPTTTPTDSPTATPIDYTYSGK